jgi:hypothetical protein
MIHVCATMANWTADEARDLLGQYVGDIIDDLAEPQWNETEDTMVSSSPSHESLVKITDST